MTTNGTITVMDLTRDIKPKPYTVTELVRMQAFPWARDHRTIIKMITEDLAGENILRAEVSGSGRQRRYQIHGTHIINYIQKYGAVLIPTARKPKQQHG